MVATDPALRPDAYGNVAGNNYDKYGSRNPIARALMNGFLGAFDDLVGKAAPRSAFEIGCGEGHLSLRLLRRGIETRGFDVEEDLVAGANRAAGAEGFGSPFGLDSVYDLGDRAIEADLILCCEVLEHLPDPERALQRIAAQGAAHVLLSVPREPIWRALNLARGKYAGQLGNTPGHIQHWSRKGFIDFVSRHLEPVEVRSPLPWTMLLCRPRRA